MVQMEIASPVLGFSPGGALTLDGPNPTLSMPNSGVFTVHGSDASATSCGETAQSNHPAIDGYDDPNNPTTPSAVTDIINAIPSGNASNYTGSGSTPSVQNGYGALGPTMTTPTGLNQLIGNITTTAQTLGTALGGHVYTGSPANETDSTIALGTCPTGNPKDASCKSVIDVVQGNLTLDGNKTGYGVLLVEGTLTLKGNFTWNGEILVIGDGIFTYSGGGGASIRGNLLTAKIWNGNGTTYPNTNLLGTHDVGSPNFNWNGGGNNGLQYDHCWSDNLMSEVQGTYTTTDSYKVLSVRILPY